MTPDKELRYQARIRELREALEVALDRHSSYTWKFGDAAKFHSALSRPDDLSALEAYVREEKRKVPEECLLEAHHTGDGWALAAVDRKNEIVCYLAWPESWPETMTTAGIKQCGFKIEP